eukprot:m.35998 g.35998  ORF g.35998 m.35998 type:complete len:78 (+) comp11361_c1_seq2:940-1173(+)
MVTQQLWVCVTARASSCGVHARSIEQRRNEVVVETSSNERQVFNHHLNELLQLFTQQTFTHGSKNSRHSQQNTTQRT